MDVVMVYSTWPDAGAARACGEKLIRERKAACATVVPGGTSVYLWQGKIEHSEEALLLVKTSASRASEARDLIVTEHPYELPCVTVFRIERELSHARFADWIASEVE
jgi:periplasmic divalent cation tolerance protein